MKYERIDAAAEYIVWTLGIENSIRLQKVLWFVNKKLLEESDRKESLSEEPFVAWAKGPTHLTTWKRWRQHFWGLDETPPEDIINEYKNHPDWEMIQPIVDEVYQEHRRLGLEEVIRLGQQEPGWIAARKRAGTDLQGYESVNEPIEISDVFKTNEITK